MALVLNGTTGVSGVAGSATAPALIGTDADSGYYINSANEPNASVNGTAVWNAASTFGFKNRFINGAMMIDQRNAGASVTPTSGANTYNLDRWNTYQDGASKLTVQQNAGSVTPPAGFKNYLGITSSSANSPTSGQFYYLAQSIEGYNTSDLGFGAAGASSVTISFWVRSSLTGNFGAALVNYAYSRSYAFTFVINSANTWEYKTVTIPGDTAGTWVGASNAGAMTLYINLGSGSGNFTTANTWNASGSMGPTGSTNILGTNGATFYITGVQLEKGSTATSFDYRPYGTELALCQRYYEKTFNQASAPAQGANSTAFGTGINKVWRVDWNATFTSGTIATPTTFMVVKRAAPTVTTYGNSSGQVNVLNFTAGTNTWSSATNQAITDRGFEQYTGTVGSAGQWGVIYFGYTADAEL